MTVQFFRKWSHPNKHTFKMPPARAFRNRWLEGGRVIVDPFAGTDFKLPLSTGKFWLNDLNPRSPAEFHLEAPEFLAWLRDEGVIADRVIFDPPYSPRQVKESYESIGLKATQIDTQTATLKATCRDLINEITATGAICLYFGFNSIGMGTTRGWELLEQLNIYGGGDHNDVICTAWVKVR